MFSQTNRVIRWLMLIGSGAVMLQATTGCDTLELLQTGLLGGITAMMYIVTKNV